MTCPGSHHGFIGKSWHWNCVLDPSLGSCPICCPSLSVLGVLPGGGDSEVDLKGCVRVLRGEACWEWHSRVEQHVRGTDPPVGHRVELCGLDHHEQSLVFREKICGFHTLGCLGISWEHVQCRFLDPAPRDFRSIRGNCTSHRLDPAPTPQFRGSLGCTWRHTAGPRGLGTGQCAGWAGSRPLARCLKGCACPSPPTFSELSPRLTRHHFDLVTFSYKREAAPGGSVSP